MFFTGNQTAATASRYVIYSVAKIFDMRINNNSGILSETSRGVD